jgi:hypothetical protein
MALITEFAAVARERHQIRSRTRCTYSIFTGSDGSTYVQLDTFGSADREFPNKVSQSIQLNERGASEMLQILVKAFPSLAHRRDSEAV